MIKFLKRALAALMLFFGLASMALAQATADADITAAVDTYSANWAKVKVALVAVGVFLVGWGLVKKLRRA